MNWPIPPDWPFFRLVFGEWWELRPATKQGEALSKEFITHVKGLQQDSSRRDATPTKKIQIDTAKEEFINSKVTSQNFR